MNETIKIKLSSAMMDDVSETDFDAWVAYVRANIDNATGIKVAEIDQFPFGAVDDDQLSGADADRRAILRVWLSSDGWDAFCADDPPLPERRPFPGVALDPA